MAYMLNERIATAVVTGYLERTDAADELARAEAARQWLAGLAVEPSVRAGVVESVAAIEAGLREVLRRQGKSQLDHRRG